MNRMIKKFSAVAVALVLTVTMLTTGTEVKAASASANFVLRYYSSAPTDVNIIRETRIIAASGKDRVYVKSTAFNCLISGGSAYFKCSDYDSTGASIVKANQTKELIFKGTTIPKAGVSVAIDMKLKDYAISQRLSCEGRVCNSK